MNRCGFRKIYRDNDFKILEEKQKALVQLMKSALEKFSRALEEKN